MSLRTGFAIAGGVVGGFLGNPQLGYAIGSMVGSAVDPQTIPGPKLGEIPAQTSQEGGPRPMVLGISQPMAGNIIVCGEPNVVKSKQSSGKGGPKVEVESVYRTYAIGICEGPIMGVLRVWRNNVLVYDAREEPTLPPEDSAAFLETARFFLGDFEQLPSSDLEAMLGVGTTPAFRGTAYMVMALDDLTDLGGAVPQYTFQVDRDASHTLRYGKKGVVRNVITTNGGAVNGTWIKPDGVSSIGILLVGAGGRGEIVNIGSTGAPAGGGGGGGEVKWVENYPVTGNCTWRISNNDADINGEFGYHTSSLSTNDDTWFNAQDLVAMNGGNGNGNNTGGGNGVTSRATGGGGSVGFRQSDSFLLAQGPGVSIIGLGDGGNYSPATPVLVTASPRYGGGGGGAGGDGRSGASPHGGPGKYMGHIVGRDLGEAGWFGGGGGGGANAYGLGLRGRGGIGGGGTGHNGYQEAPGVFDPGHGGPVWGSVTDGGTSGKRYTGGGGGAACGQGTNVAVYGAAGLIVVLYYDPAVWGNDYQAPQGIAALEEMVRQICFRAGLTEDLIDTDDLSGISCYGLTVTNQYSSIEALKALGRVHMFDVAPRDGKIAFILRGKDSVATIAEDDLVDEGDSIADEDEMRDDAISVPRVLHLNYHDIEGGLASDKQTSTRAGDRRSVGEQSIQSPVIMDANTAARVVTMTHKIDAENQKGTVRIPLSDRYIGLMPADNIIVPIGGVNRRVRIEKRDAFDGYQVYDAAYDRQSAYTSDVEGIPAAPQTPPPSSIVGETLLAVLDISFIRDLDDAVGLGYYVGVGATRDAWNGALVEISYDNGANYEDSRSTNTSSVMGILADPISDHPVDYPDEVNRLLIDISYSYSALESTDYAGILNRKNLCAVGDEVVGYELMNFMEAEEVAEGQWEASYLLRGRKGTGSRAHTAGEKFILLDRNALFLINATLFDIGKTLTFRTTSIGQATSSGIVTTIVFNGNIQRERAIGWLEAERDGANMDIRFVGVGRLSGNGTLTHSQHFSGYRVTFLDGTNPNIVVNVNSGDLDSIQDLTQDVSSLSVSPITVRVEQMNDITGAGPAMEVVIV